MASASSSPPASPEQESSLPRAEERRRLREEQLREELKKLELRHQLERKVLSHELLEIAFARRDLQAQLWKKWGSPPCQQRQLSAELPTPDRGLVEHGEKEAASNLECQEHEDGATSSAGAALNGMQGPEKGDEEKQALLALLPAKTELRLEIQRLVEFQEKKALQQVYQYRIYVEDPREIISVQAYNRTHTEARGTAQEDIRYVDSRMGLPRLPEAYQEVRRLLDIEQNPIFSKMLDEWNRKGDMLSLRRVDLLNQVANVKNEVYQLLAFFSVFQGVVLTAVSTSSLLYCHNVWSPIALSVLASVISTFGVIQKRKQINDLQMTMDFVDRDIKTAAKVGRLLREPGPGGIDFFQLHRAIKGDSSQPMQSSTKRRRLNFVILLAFVAFGALFPISFWRILCKPGAPPPAQ